MARGRSLLGSPTVQTLLLFVAVFAVSRVFLIVHETLFLMLFVLHDPMREPWAVVTSVYSHANLGHLISNSIGLVIAGIVLERSTTRWAYHLFFVFTGALAGASHVWAPEIANAVFSVVSVVTFGLVSVPSVQGAGVLGASGAVFAMFGYVLAGNRLSTGVLDSVGLGKHAQLLVFLVIAAAITWATASPGVALVGHFTGLFVGLLAGRAGILPDRAPSERRPRSTSYNSGR